jgi:hypothetical protein
MLRSPYRYISVTLAAGEVRPMPIYAPFVRLLSNTSATDPEISFDGSFETFPAGLSIKLPASENFREIQIKNPSGGSMTLVLAFASEEVTDTRLTLSGSVFTDILNELQGDNVPEVWGNDITVGVAAVQVLALNNTRKSLLIQADIANTGIIYLGYDNTVSSVKKAATLQPGNAWSADDYRGVVWAISGVAGQKVSASEV